RERFSLTDSPGPFSPPGSLYLKPGPIVSVAVQNGLPVLLVPCGRTKDWLLDVGPKAKNCKMAPPALPARVGSPTIVAELPFSLLALAILRFVASTPGFGSFTVSDLPRIVCSEAKARLAAHAIPAAPARNLEKFCMSTLLTSLGPPRGRGFRNLPPISWAHPLSRKMHNEHRYLTLDDESPEEVIPTCRDRGGAGRGPAARYREASSRCTASP